MISGCATPSGLLTTNIAQEKATLHWNPVSGAEGYKVRFKAKNSGTWSVLSSGDTSKKIPGLSAGATYIWQVKTICSTAPVVSSEWSAKEEFTTQLRLSEDDESLSLLSVYPNPVRTEALLGFIIPESHVVTLELFDISGKRMFTLLNQKPEAGNHQIPLGRNQLDSGSYLLKYTAGDETEAVKIIIE